MSAELPLSIKTRLVLKPSIMSMMTKGHHVAVSLLGYLLLKKSYPGFPFFSVLTDASHGRYLLDFTEIFLGT